MSVDPSSGLQYCLNCDPNTAEFDNNTSNCTCKSGFDTFSKVGWTLQCNATCDATSTNFDSANNVCLCKTGFT